MNPITFSASRPLMHAAAPSPTIVKTPLTFSFQNVMTQLIQQTEVILNICQQTQAQLSAASEKITRTKQLAGMTETYALKAQIGTVDTHLDGGEVDAECWRLLQLYFEQNYSDPKLPSGNRSISKWVTDPANKEGSIWDINHKKETYQQEDFQALSIYFSEHDQQMQNYTQEVQSRNSLLLQRYNVCQSTDTSISDLIFQLKRQLADGLT